MAERVMLFQKVSGAAQRTINPVTLAKAMKTPEGLQAMGVLRDPASTDYMREQAMERIFELAAENRLSNPDLGEAQAVLKRQETTVELHPVFKGADDNALGKAVVWAMIEKGGAEIRLPSETKEQSVAKFLGTPAGAELYREFQECGGRTVAQIRADASQKAAIQKAVPDSHGDWGSVVDYAAKTEMLREPGLSYLDALKKVQTNMPDLFAAYERERR